MSVTEGSLQGLRQGNRARLLELLLHHGALHRAELARRAHLSRSTVSTIVADLVAEGLVVESTSNGVTAHTGAGRPGGLLKLNPAGRLAVGIDISYSTLRVVVADLAHTVLARAQGPTPVDESWMTTLDVGVQLIDRALAEAGAGREQVLGVGLGLPGPVDQTARTVGMSGSSLAWSGVRAEDELAERLGVPVTSDNTSHLGSLAESVWGAGIGCQDLLYLKLSTGVGGGLLVGGRIFRGAVGAAGEIGHMTVDDTGPACRCGNRGCLELYAGVPAVLAALRPVLGDDVTLEVVLGQLRRGNRACQRVIGDVGVTLGRTLAGVCNLLNPRRVVVGGELAGAGEVLLEPLRASLDRHALPIISGALEVVPGVLGGMAGALGGVVAVLRQGELPVTA